MCGPLWAAMHVVIVERYKQGKRAMRSIVGGAGSFRWSTNTGLLLLPITSFVEPILPVGLALTLIIQGFVSVRVGIMEAKNQKEGFADAQADFTELAELNDLDADGRPIDPNAPKPKGTTN